MSAIGEEIAPIATTGPDEMTRTQSSIECLVAATVLQKNYSFVAIHAHSLAGVRVCAAKSGFDFTQRIRFDDKGAEGELAARAAEKIDCRL
jgi:hypothetical protein